ncbi:rCG20051 [Rattus norvegicus]|uniref:RCG20051 n=1 Tax=Rattus norvegicus TaxID=10116 RepID=A6KT17_RAT|nr:rCG20051 [Rattus norvegicus]
MPLNDPFVVSLVLFPCARRGLCCQLIIGNCLPTQCEFLSTVQCCPFAWKKCKVNKATEKQPG